MMASLNNAGWDSAPQAETADLIIINSCGFIESAKQESINAVLGWRKLYPGKKILLAGCLAQRYAKELAEALPEADGLFGIDDPAGITEAAADAVAKAAANAVADAAGIAVKDEAAAKHADSVEEVPAAGKFAEGRTGWRPLLSMPGSAYVKISEGCDNRCSYCAIPLIWGNLRSRDITDITEECRVLLTRGVKELCIIGQDIGSFGIDTPGNLRLQGNYKLPELLHAISRLEGHFWVRLLYIHPDHFPLPILDIMEKDARFLPYFDIPFQHASAKILAAMNRRGTAEKYLELIENIRSRFSGAVIRSTFLLGFPGETDEDFEYLLDFQEKAKLDWLGCFTYSREDGTAAYSMTKQIPKKTAAMRKKIIEERQIPITEKNMERFTGQKLTVLIEEQIDDFWLGRLYCQAPDIDGAAVISGSMEQPELQSGMFVPCKVIARRGFDLEVSVV